MATSKTKAAQGLLENSSLPSTSQQPPPSRPRPPVILPPASPSAAGPSQSSVQNPPRNARSPSVDWPEWDIELDLNPSDDDDIAYREDTDLGPARKKQKMSSNLTMS